MWRRLLPGLSVAGLVVGLLAVPLVAEAAAAAARLPVPVAHWGLEIYPGITASSALADQVAAPTDSPLTPAGVSWPSDVRRRGAQTATFDGASSAATTESAVVDTTGSFSVGGWVRLGARPATDITFATQEAADAPGFEIGIRRSGRPAVPHWSFAMKNTAAQSSTTVVAAAPAAITAADAGLWTHVAGSFDAAQMKLRLYVDGVLVSEVDRTATPWAASGKFAVGRGFAGGVATGWWNGSIADVRVYDRVLAPEDFTGQVVDGFNEPGILGPVRVGRWDFETATPCFVADLRDTCEAPDMSIFERTLALTLGADVGPGHTAGGQALWLDSEYFPDGGTPAGEATQEYGRSAIRTGTTAPDADGNEFTIWQDAPVLLTDQSFTVSAWVKLDAVEAGGSPAVLAQAGVHESATWLRYDSGTGAWEFAVFAADASTATTHSPTRRHARTAAYARATDTAELDEWTHLTGVFDASHHEARLYVNGTRVATRAVPFTPMASDGTLLVGRTRQHDQLLDKWSGGIDDLTIYQGPLTDAAVSAMYTAQATSS
ncbi:LamG domain-containing protein [Actinoplanes sp. NPDC026619]|uniref:LamG domain-containing protein n=1 Tax=Actinoplanes sp. NPDC026619 TaxID=3155798 RepID=UPI0033FD173C